MAAAVVAALLLLGYEAKHPAYTEHQLDPQAMFQDPTADPRILEVGVTWNEEGWCVGQFTVKVDESDNLISVGRVVDREYVNGNCAGVGTADSLAWAEITLASPLGRRLVIRGSDRVALPMHVRPLAPRDPQSADVERWGGLNDSPPSALEKTAHLNSNQAGRLASLIENLPSFPAAMFFCPYSDGSYYRAIFHYTGFADRTVRVELRGCQEVFLGDSLQPARWAVNQPDLYAYLDSFVSN